MLEIEKIDKPKYLGKKWKWVIILVTILTVGHIGWNSWDFVSEKGQLIWGRDKGGREILMERGGRLRNKNDSSIVYEANYEDVTSGSGDDDAP